MVLFDVFNRNREVISKSVLEQRKKQQTALMSRDLEKALPLRYTIKDISKSRLWMLKGKMILVKNHGLTESQNMKSH